MEHVFGAMGDVSWFQECARSVLIFAYGLALVRSAGRRIFGKWSALDIIVAFVIGSNLSRALTGGAPLGARSRRRRCWSPCTGSLLIWYPVPLRFPA